MAIETVTRLAGRLLATLTLGLFSLCCAANSGFKINTDPNALVGQKIVFFTLDANDVKLLEPACVVSLTNPHVLKTAWPDIIKDNPILNNTEFHILHGTESLYHYCRGKAAKLRYYKERDRIMKNRLLESMVWEFSYMVNNPHYMPDNWPFMKTMYLELGMARMLENKAAPALQAFQNALTLDPSYEQAHISGTDAWIALGKQDKALLQATEGLAHNPDSKPLKRRYLKLGGKTPFPAPHEKPGTEAKGEPSAQDAASAKPTEGQVTNNEARGHAAGGSSQDKPAEVASEAAKDISRLPGAGAGADVTKDAAADQGQEHPPNNPYCRFCP